MQKNLIALLFAVCVLLGIGTVVLCLSGDRTAPVIQFNGENLAYREEWGEDMLLRGVTAVDDRDGDVTSSLLVENVYIHKDAQTATVVYVARDKANNIAKAKREVLYSELPVETNSETESETESATEPETESEAEPTTEDTWEQERPKLQLKANAVTIAVGQTVNRLSYVDSVSDDKDTKEDLWTRIHIDGDVLDSNTPGTYKLVYYVADSDGNRSERQTLTITVH